MLVATHISNSIDEYYSASENFIPIVEAFLYNKVKDGAEVFIPFQLFMAMLNAFNSKKLIKFNTLLEDFLNKNKERYNYLRNPQIGYKESEEFFFAPFQIKKRLHDHLPPDNAYSLKNIQNTFLKSNIGEQITEMMEKELKGKRSDDSVESILAEINDSLEFENFFSLYLIKDKDKRINALKIAKAAPHKALRLMNIHFKEKPYILSFYKKYLNSSITVAQNAKFIALKYFFVDEPRVEENVNTYLDFEEDSDSDDSMDPEDIEALAALMKKNSIKIKK